MSKRGVDSVASTAAVWRAIVEHPLPDVIGSYANGRFANTNAANEAFPNLMHVEYDVNGSRPDAEILDIEKLDATPATFPGWAHRYTGSLPLPAGYCSASVISAVVSAMLDAGFHREQFLVQSAHYTFTEHICGPHTCGFPQADSTQYADKGRHGQNTDLTIYDDHFFGPLPPPKPDMHYGWFENKPFLIFGNRYSERSTVMEYDKLRATQTRTKHPNRARLTVLRARLLLLSGRLWRVGRKLPDRPASWGLDHRGFRFQGLRARAKGHRVV